MHFRFRDGYNGSSFTELLDTEFPHLKPDLSGPYGRGAELAESTHGTTVLGLRYSDGVLVAGDRLATAGNAVASRDIEKVYACDEHSLIAIAGAAGPSIEMARVLRIQFEHREKIEGEPLELEGKANTLSQMIRQNLPAAMQGLVVVPIFGGFDLRRRMGRVWKYEITGGRYEEREFESMGSGSIIARESLKKTWHPRAARDDGIRMALEALTDAADEDVGTGGVDSLRGLYPRVKLCTERGVESVPDEEIAQVHQQILESRRRPAE